MSNWSVRLSWNGAVVFLFFAITLILAELYGQVLERGIGYYLKWQNPGRQQLGRIWDKERKNIVAQGKVQTILSNFDSREQSSESMESFKALFEALSSSQAQVVSREKFLQLYFDYPGQWSHRVISPYDLIEIDSNKKWKRVFLNASGPWINVDFIDGENNPIRQTVVLASILQEIQLAPTIKRGRLEDAGFSKNLIFPIKEFLPLLQTLDAATQKALFPDPQWFLEKNYHVTRLGISTARGEANGQAVLLGIEYETDFRADTLLIPVPPEVADNLLSQIERSDMENSENPPKVVEQSYSSGENN